MKKIYRWKFLREGFRSQNGVLKWKIGKWNKVEGKLSMCENGLHCSKNIFDAFIYVSGEILARVECRGDHIIGTDKECWREMRVVKAYEWAKKDSVAIAIYAARLDLPIFEKIYPEDKKPRKAIEAAVKWLKNPIEKNRIAAEMAANEARMVYSLVAKNKAKKKLKETNKILIASRVAVKAAEIAGKEKLEWATSELFSLLLLYLVELKNEIAIKKLQARFDKQVKELKEIKNEKVG